MLMTLRAILFWVGFMVSTIAVTAILFFTFIFPFKIRFLISQAWPKFNLWWLRITCGLRYEVEGIENIPDYPVIIMSNHQSTWETLAIHNVFPALVWVLKRELMWIPVFGWGMIMMRSIAINRSKGGEAMAQLMQQGKKRIKQGINIVIFPEGTRAAPGSKTKFRIGGAMLAEELGVPVVPVAHNAGYFWPRKQLEKHPGTIKMVIGKPIDTKGLNARQINLKVKRWIDEAVQEIGEPRYS